MRIWNTVPGTAAVALGLSVGLAQAQTSPGTPEDYAAFIDKDEKKWVGLVKASGVKQE